MPSRSLCRAKVWFGWTGCWRWETLETGDEILSRSRVGHIFKSPFCFDDDVEGQTTEGRGCRASDSQRMPEFCRLLLVDLTSADVMFSLEFFTRDEPDEDPSERPRPSPTAAIGTESVEMVAIGGLACCFLIRGGGWSVV